MSYLPTQLAPGVQLNDLDTRCRGGKMICIAQRGDPANNVQDTCKTNDYEAVWQSSSVNLPLPFSLHARVESTRRLRGWLTSLAGTSAFELSFFVFSRFCRYNWAPSCRD